MGLGAGVFCTVLSFFLPLLLPVAAATGATAAVPERRPSCKSECGGVHIPFPFGVGDGCYAREYGNFNITCNNAARAFLGTGNVEVVNISLTGELRVMSGVGYDCYDQTGQNYTQNQWLRLGDTPFTLSHTRNVFVALGCDTIALIGGQRGVLYTGGCISYCDSPDGVTNRSCSGVGCCQTAIPRGIRTFDTDIGSYYNHSGCWGFNKCGYAFVVEENGYTFQVSHLNDTNFDSEPRPIVLHWSIGNQNCKEAKKQPRFACRSNNSDCFDSSNGVGYICNCTQGYTGNPYLRGGCQDVNECLLNSTICPGHKTCVNTNGSYGCVCPPGTVASSPPEVGLCTAPDDKNNKQGDIPLALKLGIGIGLGFMLLLMAASSSVCWGFLRRKLMEERRKVAELRQRMFQHNGGPLLQDHISSQPGNTFRIFTEEELARATNNFDDDLIIGRGGHGIVYKGRLEDDRDVAIKKSKMVDERQSKEFAREMAILSQINHVNVVKLLGCCLEVEIPMLVYEYVQCGTLYDFIHYDGHRGPLPLDARLRIATEAAEALAYLHSFASPPILHGDVKTSNLLLDDQYRAKVSDFGASTLAPVDEVQLATVVQGTCGYLDPEYMQTYQPTVKSDVYSFGVVLAELLTGKKPLHLDGPEDDRSLAVNFVSSLRENKLMQILDAQIVKEGEIERLWELAELASRCLSMKGDDRPTMKEVVGALYVLGRSGEHPWIPYAPEEAERLLDGGIPSTYESSDAGARYLSMENHALCEMEAGR